MPATWVVLDLVDGQTPISIACDKEEMDIVESALGLRERATPGPSEQSGAAADGSSLAGDRGEQVEPNPQSVRPLP